MAERAATILSWLAPPLLLLIAPPLVAHLALMRARMRQLEARAVPARLVLDDDAGTWIDCEGERVPLTPSAARPILWELDLQGGTASNDELQLQLLIVDARVFALSEARYELAQRLRDRGLRPRVRRALSSAGLLLPFAFVGALLWALALALCCGA